MSKLRSEILLINNFLNYRGTFNLLTDQKFVEHNLKIKNAIDDLKNKHGGISINQLEEEIKILIGEEQKIIEQLLHYLEKQSKEFYSTFKMIYD